MHYNICVTWLFRHMFTVSHLSLNSYMTAQGLKYLSHCTTQFYRMKFRTEGRKVVSRGDIPKKTVYYIDEARESLKDLDNCF